MSVYILGYNQYLPSTFTEVEVSKAENLSFISGELELDGQSEYHPGRSDEKIMRQDVKAAIIASNEMLKDVISKNERASLSLYVASGSFVESLDIRLGQFISTYEKFSSLGDDVTKMNKVYRGTPPLLALQTLTNAAMSFIAQYTGIKGNNVTFGNTSISAFHAISEGVDDVMFNGNKSVICSSNTGGPHSYLMNAPSFQNVENWKESAAVGTLILTHELNDKAVCKLRVLPVIEGRPNFYDKEIRRTWGELIKDENADALVFTGAYTKESNGKDQEYCDQLNSNTYGLFEEYGNMGSANLIVGINKGIELIKEGLSSVQIVDRDIFGRESGVIIESIHG